MSAMAEAQINPKAVTGLEAFELAAVRNAPLSVSTPGEQGKSPMARGRFLLPQDGSVLIENLQVPGRAVAIRKDQPIEAYFQHDGTVYQFRSRVLEMDTPVHLNNTLVVRGMRIAAPTHIERGNRRTIYRQSFASVQPAVGVRGWAVPLSMLTPEQRAACAVASDPTGEQPKPVPGPGPVADGEMEGFRVERGVRCQSGLLPAETLYETIPGLTLDQVAPLMDTEAHWTGEVADASEFGIGIVLHGLLYSRLKVFQPMVVRFTLPGADVPLSFLFEIRRVQGVGDESARVGGLLLINALNAAEVRASRDLARYTLELQRERAKRVREAG